MSRAPAEKTPSHAILDRESRLSKARKIVAVLHAFVGELRQRDVLDIGTGAGIIAAYVAERAKSLVTVDVVDERVEKTVPFKLVGDESLPFPSGAFDVVITNHVIEHVADQEMHLREIHRVLRDGGVCYLATPNRYRLVEPHYKLPLLSWPPSAVRNLYLKVATGRQSYDIRPLTYGELARHACKLGFEMRDVAPDLLKAPDRYAVGTGFVWRGISLIPRWFLCLMRPVLPSFVVLLRKRESGEGGVPSGSS